MNDRLTQALEKIDEVNRNDPSLERCGTDSVPKAWLYGQRMSEWLYRLDTAPSEALQIAARGQHIARWQIPRTAFPATRAGYLAWRTRLYGFHAEQLAAILRQLGYDDATIEQVARIVSKKGLKQDPDVQRIEDVACLVFLDHEFEPFAASHPREKVVEIVRKTWNKMSDAGRQAALQLALPEPLSKLVADALAQ